MHLERSGACRDSRVEIWFANLPTVAPTGPRELGQDHQNPYRKELFREYCDVKKCVDTAVEANA